LQIYFSQKEKTKQTQFQTFVVN